MTPERPGHAQQRLTGIVAPNVADPADHTGPFIDKVGHQLAAGFFSAGIFLQTAAGEGFGDVFKVRCAAP